MVKPCYDGCWPCSALETHVTVLHDARVFRRLCRKTYALSQTSAMKLYWLESLTEDWKETRDTLARTTCQCDDADPERPTAGSIMGKQPPTA